MSQRHRSPEARFGLAVPILAILGLAIGCGGSDSLIVDPDPAAPTNQAPVATATISAQTVAIAGNAMLELSSFFSDPDGDALAYEASSSNAFVAGVSISGSQLTMVGVSRGVAEGIVTVRDQ